MASAAAVTPLGLLHMRPLQHWLHSRVPRWAWRRGTLRIGISQQCCRSLSPWTDLAFLRAVVPPRTSVPAYCCHNRCLQHGLWALHATGRQPRGSGTGPRLLWQHQLPGAVGSAFSPCGSSGHCCLGKHVLVRTDKHCGGLVYQPAGGIRSHRMSQLARHLLLWSHTQFKVTACCSHPGAAQSCRPTRSHDSSRSPESGDSIPRRSG